MASGLRLLEVHSYPLWCRETFLTDVEEELLKLGEDVNARNKDGETPIFTTVDNDAIPLFMEHGADLTTTRARR
jgi:ankyrin repeat protein